MDPNANWARCVSLAMSLSFKRDCYDDEQDFFGDIDELAELVLALDGWLSKGGFPPHGTEARR